MLATQMLLHTDNAGKYYSTILLAIAGWLALINALYGSLEFELCTYEYIAVVNSLLN